MKELQLVHPEKKYPAEAVRVGFGRVGQTLRVFFRVEALTLHANPELDCQSSHWGLWDWDVVELFLAFRPPNGSARSGSLPYFEFQVSPLGQRFELKVLKPRQEVDASFRPSWKQGARILRAPDETGTHTRWEAWMEIPLGPLGWDGNPASLVGGAFAILSRPPQSNPETPGAETAPTRCYWALSLPAQSTPDFHLPEHFRPLLEQEIGDGAVLR